MPGLHPSSADVPDLHPSSADVPGLLMPFVRKEGGSQAGVLAATLLGSQLLSDPLYLGSQISSEPLDLEMGDLDLKEMMDLGVQGLAVQAPSHEELSK